MEQKPIQIDSKIRFLISVPDWRPEEVTPFQGFSPSLCENSGFLRFIQRMPTDIFELTPDVLPHRISLRIAGLSPINWYGQSPRALKSIPFPIEAAFTFIILDKNEDVSNYKEWIEKSPCPVTLIAHQGGHIAHDALSYSALQKRLLEVCKLVRTKNLTTNINDAEAAIASWALPKERHLEFKVGGHGTIFPNATALYACGFFDVAKDPFSRHREGEKAHIEQIILTTNAVLNERDANPSSLPNLIYPRRPDLNLYCPATYELKPSFSLHSDLDRTVRRTIETTLRILNQQDGYSFEAKSEVQSKALLGISLEDLKNGKQPRPNPLMTMRQKETWLGTEAVSCLSASEIGAVVRLPNRLNHTRGIVRQFAQHYRADNPQLKKRGELFRNVQKALADAFPADFLPLIKKSKDGLRVIADAHIEWLDLDGIPLGLRYNATRIPVTPGNSFIHTLATQPIIAAKLEDFKDILVVSGLSETDVIAEQFKKAFDTFGKQWRDKLRIKFVRIASKDELIREINAFKGMMMVFDGHGSHQADHPGVLWLGEQPVDIWSLRGDVHRAPPIVILSACDTHAADRNHATVANGFLALGSRSVLGSVFPLHASHAALFTARLLYRVSDYIPAAITHFERSLTWLEVVSGMLRHQLTTDILRQLQLSNLISADDFSYLHMKMQALIDSGISDPFASVIEALLEHGIPEAQLKIEMHKAISTSSTISYLHLGRPETILINTDENLENWEKLSKRYTENITP